MAAFFLFQNGISIGICNLAYIGERKNLCHSFGKAVHPLLAVCMLVQEVTDMLFYIGLGRRTPYQGISQWFGGEDNYLKRL